MATIYSVETPNGVELKSGFRKLDTARKWAYEDKDPYYSGRMVVCAKSNGNKRYLGTVSHPGLFSTRDKECVWIPFSNPKNLKYVVNKDGSITRK